MENIVRKKKDPEHDSDESLLFSLVPMARLELARVSPPPPQGGASTNFTTSA